jgi:hypothetical protein
MLPEAITANGVSLRKLPLVEQRLREGEWYGVSDSQGFQIGRLKLWVSTSGEELRGKCDSSLTFTLGEKGLCTLFEGVFRSLENAMETRLLAYGIDDALGVGYSGGLAGCGGC